MRNWTRILTVLLLAGGYVAADATRPATGAVTVRVEGESYRITGPYGNDRLSVFLLHSGKRDRRAYLTLHEALRKKTVRVTEKGAGEVNSLLVSNDGDEPVFIQEGDCIQGGKQDRTFYSSLVVPGKTRNMAVPAFCVEPDRWVAGDRGATFAAPSGAALAPKSVRQAAKYENDQGRVWDAVARNKDDAVRLSGAPNRTTSLNEALDSAQVKRLFEKTVRSLGDLAARHPDAVGVAVSVNGRIEEVNIYPANSLLGKLYPRLLRSYALQAAGAGEGRAKTRRPRPFEVARFMTEDPARAAPAAPRHASTGSSPRQMSAGMGVDGVVDRDGRVLNEGFGDVQRVNGSYHGDAGVTPSISAYVQDYDQSGPMGSANRGGPVINGHRDVYGAARIDDRTRRLGRAPAADRVETLPGRNSLRVREGAARVQSVTEFEGKAVHRQFMRK